MKKNLQLLWCMAAVLPLTMCQSGNELIPAGTLTASEPEADALLSAARNHVAQNKLSAAESALERIIKRYDNAPCVPEARFLLAEVYEKQGVPRDAFDEYDKIITRYQSSNLYNKSLDRQLSLAMAAAEGSLKVPVFGMWESTLDSSTVEEWLGKVILNAPYNDMAATATSILGKFLVKQEKFEEAAMVYNKLVEDYPNSRYAPEAQLMVAQLWATSRTRGDQNLVNLRRAQEAYEEFSLRFPGHADAGKALSEASNMRRLLVRQELEVGRYYLERSREYTSAIFCFENVIRQKNNNPEAAKEAETLLARARSLQAVQNANLKKS
ncbi:MAG: tetratricopeptide repeat protein [Akkermansia sp.]|nr:tetratricopeptide repeat protein [Akkermansia sp.]